MFEGYCANVLHIGDTTEADNPMDNITCQDILINVIVGCESEMWRLRFGEQDMFALVWSRPGQCQWQCARNVGIKNIVNFNNYSCFANKVRIDMFIKFITLFYWSASCKKLMTTFGMVYIY